MPRFFVSAALLFSLIFGGVWYWAMAHPMDFLNGDYPNWKAKSDLMSECNGRALAIIGDSSGGVAAKPDMLGDQTMNYGLPAAHTADILMETKRLLACKTQPKAVLLLANFLAFSHENNRFWERSVAFNTLGITFDDLEALRRQARQVDDTDMFGPYKPFDIDARFRNHLAIVKFPSYYFGSLLEGRWNNRLQKNQQIYSKAVTSRGHIEVEPSKGNWDPLYRDIQHYDVPTTFQLSMLDNIIALYQERHIDVYYIGAPYKESDIRAFSPATRAEFEGFLATYEKRYPNFHVVGDVFPAFPNEDFLDGIHVNAQGVAAYSTYLAGLLRENHIEH